MLIFYWQRTKKFYWRLKLLPTFIQGKKTFIVVIIWTCHIEKPDAQIKHNNFKCPKGNETNEKTAEERWQN